MPNDIDFNRVSTKQKNMHYYPVYEKGSKYTERTMEDDWKKGRAYIRTCFETPLSSVKEANEITNKIV